MRLWKRTSSQSVTFEAFGVQVKLALDEPELEALVQEILPPGWRRCEVGESAGQFGLRRTEADSYDVTIGDAPAIEHATLDVALGMLDAQIRLFIAATAREWIFVHAGVVARNGRALVVPGESFSGKTTLVRALVEAGATYYSDEYAVLDAEGCVHPYARRLSIRGDGTRTTQERGVGELGGVAAQKRSTVRAVVVTRYQPGAEWQPRRLPSGQGVLALLANTVPAQQRPAESLRAVSRAVAGAVVLDGDRGEAGPAAAAMLEAMAALDR